MSAMETSSMTSNVLDVNNKPEFAYWIISYSLPGLILLFLFHETLMTRLQVSNCDDTSTGDIYHCDDTSTGDIYHYDDTCAGDDFNPMMLLVWSLRLFSPLHFIFFFYHPQCLYVWIHHIGVAFDLWFILRRCLRSHLTEITFSQDTVLTEIPLTVTRQQS